MIDIAQRNSAETMVIRDTISEILRIVTGERDSLSANQVAAATGLSEEDKHQVEKGIAAQLLQSPSSLKAACDVNTYHLASQRRKRRLCFCQRSLVVAGSDFRALSYRTECLGSHGPNCTRYRTGQRGGSFTIRLQLLPLFQKTFEITLGATHGAGAWSISHSMKLYNTVERSKSPLFRAFDNFISIHSHFVWEASAGSVHSWYVLAPGPNQSIEFYLDRAALKQELRTFIRDLTRLFVAGKSGASDKDQYGNTILHV